MMHAIRIKISRLGMNTVYVKKGRNIFQNNIIKNSIYKYTITVY